MGLRQFGPVIDDEAQFKIHAFANDGVSPVVQQEIAVSNGSVVVGLDPDHARELATDIEEAANRAEAGETVEVRR